MPVPTVASPRPRFGKGLGLQIVALATQDGEHKWDADEYEALCRRHYPETPALTKLFQINRKTGIKSRSMMYRTTDPILSGMEAAPIDLLSQYFLRDAVELAACASRKAIAEWGGQSSEITHLVCVTCTNSANPGYDKYLSGVLGLNPHAERTLMHGVACSGGLAALRTAAALALGANYLHEPARILVVAVEVTSNMQRSELDLVHKLQTTRPEGALFGDGATAMIVTNEKGGVTGGKGVYDILGWQHRFIPNTEEELMISVHPAGWQTKISPSVPKLIGRSIKPIVEEMLESVEGFANMDPSELDWALHPGGSAIIKSVQDTMGLSNSHLRASWDRYKNFGNTSSAAVGGVMDRLREKDMGEGKEYVAAVAFGPGVAIEIIMLKRCRNEA